MLFQGNVGFQSVLDGSPNVFARLSRAAAMIVDQCNGRYYENASRGKIYSACNQAAQAYTALSTTFTGFGLNNPIGSNVQLALMDVCVAIATATGGAAGLSLAGNAAMQGVIPTTLTAETVISTLLGSKATGVGTVWNAATLATAPTVVRVLPGGAVAGSSITPPFIRDELAGQIILLPGTFIGTNRVTATSAITSMSWIETAL